MPSSRGMVTRLSSLTNASCAPNTISQTYLHFVRQMNQGGKRAKAEPLGERLASLVPLEHLLNEVQAYAVLAIRTLG